MEFGRVQQAYDQSHVLQLVDERKKEEVCAYIQKYFIKMSNNDCVLVYNPDEQTSSKFESISDKNIKSKYFPSDLIIYEGKNKFSIQKWFYGLSNPLYKPCMVLGKPELFQGQFGTKYVNLMQTPNYYHSPRKNFKDFSKEIQEKVLLIWEHINITYCSRNKQQFEYAKKWFSHMVSGRRMDSCIYVKSLQGTGKSIFIEFLKNNVLGSSLVLQTSKTDFITEKFNAPIAGKMLFCLEEAPCETLGKWHALEDNLKNLITNRTIDIEAKYKDSIVVENVTSFIIFSNKNAVQMKPDQRRFTQLDASFEKKGNKEYFDNVAEAMESKEVGEAFYNYCLEFAKEHEKFSPQFDRPVSKAMKRNIASSASPYMNFLKEEYLLKKKGLDLKLKDLYEAYEHYCEKKKIKFIEKKSDFPSRLEEMGIKVIFNSTKHKNSNWVLCDFDALLSIFQKMHLLDITDEFESKKESDEDTDHIGMENDSEVIQEIVKEEEIKEIKEEVIKKEIKELKEDPEEEYYKVPLWDRPILKKGFKQLEFIESQESKMNPVKVKSLSKSIIARFK